MRLFRLYDGFLRQADADRFNLTIIRPAGEFLHDHLMAVVMRSLFWNAHRSTRGHRHD